MGEPKETIGEVTISITEDMNLRLNAQGIMQNASFLSMASDYLIKYKDKLWNKTWVEGEGEESS